MTTIRSAVASLILTGGLAVAAAPAGAQGQAATLDQVRDMLGQFDQTAVIQILRRSCIAFPLTDEVERILREEEGAGDPFIRDLRTVCQPPAPKVESGDTTLTAGPPPNSVSPASAAVRSLLVPGLGQFATRKPAAGVAFMLAWGGALAYGLLSEEVTVECLARVESSCPAGDVRNESVKRPALAIGVGAAVAVAVVSALHARSAAGRMEFASTRRSGRTVLVEPVLPARANAGVGLQLRIHF